ncbi:hypothetical protein [Leclercia adecarboxylata]|uniref:hypothetical protein n=1 Tax=Leclercia adecarboxylata TaxID=83655 RepID=UPI0025500F9C|nr:hypothetical protein [Leclercia adecarboxylata]
MTTVAWDGKTLASDSQATASDSVCTLQEQKIFYPRDNEVWMVNGEKILAVGYAGDCGAEFEVQDLMLEGLTYKSAFNPESSFGALAVAGEGRAWIVSKDTDKTHAATSLQQDPYAMGSGGTIARAAMLCGKNAIEAVRITIEMDVYSGGRVQSFTTSAEAQNIKQD